MFARVTGFFVLLATIPAWSQVEPGATGGTAATDNDSQMMTPPPVSGSAYPTGPGSETRSNFLSAGVNIVGGYLDNLYSDTTGASSNGGTISIRPNLMFFRSTSRQQETMTYSPSILLYEPASELDTVDQQAAIAFEDRLSPAVSVSLQDFFFRTADVFDQSYTFSEGGITGSTQSPTAAVIAPFARQLNDTAQGVVSYQFGRNGMVGGGANYSFLSYSGLSSSSGLSNFNGGGASAFYNRRLTSKQYMGLTYQYSRSLGEAGNQQSDTQTNSILPFYSFYITKTTSFSLAAGIQRVEVSVPQSLSANSWSPSIVASVGWQVRRGSLAANYSRSVSGGEGLLGAFTTSGSGVSASLRLSRTWTGSLSVFYTNFSNVAPQLVSTANGSTVSGQASLTHPLGQHFSTAFAYARIHENFASIEAVSANPNADTVTASISYQFQKPLER